MQPLQGMNVEMSPEISVGGVWLLRKLATSRFNQGK
jgi:hypothetical protein